MRPFVQAMHDVFLTAVLFLVVAFVLAFLIPEVPLRTRQDGEAETLGKAASPALD